MRTKVIEYLISLWLMLSDGARKMANVGRLPNSSSTCYVTLRVLCAESPNFCTKYYVSFCSRINQVGQCTVNSQREGCWRRNAGDRHQRSVGSERVEYRQCTGPWYLRRLVRSLREWNASCQRHFQW